MALITGAAAAPDGPTDAPSLLQLLNDTWPNTAFGSVSSLLFQLDGTLEEVAATTAFQQACRHQTGLLLSDEAATTQTPVIVVDATNASTADAQTWCRHVSSVLPAGARVAFQVFRRPTSCICALTAAKALVDTPSLALLLEDMKLLYQTQHLDASLVLPPLEMSYLDFCLWHRDYVQGPSGDAMWAYWQTSLADAPTVLHLTTDNNRPPVQTFACDTAFFDIPTNVVLAIDALCSAQGTDMSTFMLVLFQTYLLRHSGQADVLIGCLLDGREGEEVSHTVGNFQTLVPVRANMNGDPTFTSLLRQVHEVFSGSRAYRQYPFDFMRQKLSSSAAASNSGDATEALQDRYPVCQVAYEYWDAFWTPQDCYPFMQLGTPGVAGTFGGYRMNPVPIAAVTSPFELTFLVARSADVMRAALRYNVALFQPDTATRMTAHILELLHSVVANINTKLSAFKWLPDAERKLVVDTWNSNVLPFPQNVCVHQLVEAQAARTPDLPAIRLPHLTWTYAQLNAEANRIASYLRFLGVTRESLVPVFMTRSELLVAAWLGILKSGGAILPLDPKYPPERLKGMVEDAAATVIVTQESLASALPDTPARVVVLDGADRLMINAANSHNLPNVNDWRDLAYTIYTSGSTGRPKGVMLEHRGIVSFLTWCHKYYEMQPGENTLHMAGLAFDASLIETWPSLTMGCCLTMCVDDDVRLLPSALLAWIAQQNIAVAFLTTQLAEAVIEEPPPAGLKLRFLLTGGDKLHRGPRLDAPYALANIYGPTEDTVNTTFCKVPAGLMTPPPIGWSVPNTQLYILDAKMLPVPIGVYGELYLAGMQLARGYFRRDDLTKDKFLPNPFSTEPGAVMYRTGDMVRWLADGQIEFLGRIDNQVKIRGFRIELSAIEATLYEMVHLTHEVVVIAREDTPGNKRLVAYVTLVKEAVDTPAPDVIAAMRAHLRAKLPEFMVPSAFMILDALPLTANGKVDRPKLPAPAEADATQAEEFIPPRTQLESALAQLYCDVLHIDRAGPKTNFFESGGHSLSASRLLTRVRDYFHIDMPLSRIFECPQLGALAEAVKAALPFANTDLRDTASVSGIERKDDIQAGSPRGSMNMSGIAPTPLPRVGSSMMRSTGLALQPFGPNSLSFNQMSLWFLSQSPDPWSSLAYNIPCGALLPPDVNLTLLQTCLQTIVDRNDALRTFFVLQDDAPVTVIDPDHKLDVQHIHLPADCSMDKLKQIMLDETYVVFDLANGPVFKCRFYYIGASVYMLLTVHHIAVDLWSYVLLLEQLRDLYTKGLTFQAPDVDLATVAGRQALARHCGLQTPVPYHACAEAQWQVLTTSRGPQVLSYWKSVLSEPLPSLLLPTDFPRPAQQAYKGAAHIFNISPTLTAKLRSFCQSEGVTTYVALFSAFQAFMSRMTGQDDLLIGTPLAGRSTLASEECLGYFVNPMPLRADLSGDPSFAALVQRVLPKVVGALDNQDLPFPVLVEQLRPPRDPSRSPFFDIVFVFQKAHDLQQAGAVAHFFLGVDNEHLRLGALDLTSVGLPQRHAQFDLTLMASEGKDSIIAAWQYNTGLFLPATMARWESYFLTMLEAAVADPQQHISALPIMPAAEHQLITETWLNTAKPFPQHVCIHQLVEAQVARTPDLPAIRMPHLTWTYAQLNAQANRIANYLRFLGITREALVPVFMHRSEMLVAAWLGILKSGGVIMPLDPKYPPERLKGMVEDAAATVIITQEALVAALPETAARVIVLDGADKPIIAAAPSANLRNVNDWRDLAYAIYTSGSTGRPKGCMLEHRGIVNYMTWHNEYYELKQGENVLHNAGLAFDASMAETWPSLALGCCLVPCVDDNVRLVPSALLAWMADQKIVLAFLTTQLAEAVIEEPPPPGLVLRYLYTGGDKLHRGPRMDAPYTLVNIYGPTEDTVNTTMCKVPKGLTSPPPIGWLVPNTQLYIVDSKMQPVPIGVFGELYLAGVQLGRGYFRRDDLTKERFIPNPFSSEPGAMMYRTGDLVRWLPDGQVEFFGRIDTQVKIRGFRIELSAIESTLYELNTLIHEVVVIAREDTPGNKRLVAYATLHKHATEEDPISVMRNHLRAKLPEFMVPSAFVILDALPLTANGKVDRPKLPAPAAADTGAGGLEFVAPRNETEAALAKLYCDVLGLERAGPQTNFFDCGGHSLSASKLVSRIQSTFKVSLPLTTVFDSPTIAALAERIKVLQHRAVSAALADSFNEDSAAPQLAEALAIESTSLGSAGIPGVLADVSTSAADALDSSIIDTELMSVDSSLLSSSVKPSQLSRWLSRKIAGGHASVGSASKNSSFGRVFSALRMQRMASSEAAESGGRSRTSSMASDSGINANAGPVSYTQKSLWFLHKMDPTRVDYVVHFAAKQFAPIRVAALDRALRAIIARHPALRTTYEDRDGEPMQVIHPREAGFQLELAHVVTGDTDSAFMQRIKSQLAIPWDLTNGPIMRARLVWTDPSSTAESPVAPCSPQHPGLLILTAHHIALDGWSLDVLLNDLAILYDEECAALEAGRPAGPALEPVKINMVQHAVAQQEFLQSPDGERLWSFWQRELSGFLPVLTLPTDKPRPPIATSKGAAAMFTIGADLTARLRAFARSQRCTLYHVLLSAYAVALYRYTDQTDLLIGSPMACRNNEAMHDMVGQLANPVVLRIKLAADVSFTQLVGRARRTAVNAYANQDFPFPLLVERLVHYRDPSRSPVFQVLFSLNQRYASAESGLSMAQAEADVGSTFQVGKLLCQHVAVDQGVSPFDLQFVVSEGTSTLSAQLQYSVALWRPDTIQAMAGHILTLLDGAMARPDAPVSALPMLTGPEMAKIMVDWNKTCIPVSFDRGVHEMVADVAEHAPFSTSVMFDDCSLTFAELNARANQLAWYLRFRGVGEGSFVGLFMRRSTDYVIAMLAVLKTGAAYVPIDPAYPSDRVKYMVEDTRMLVLLTHQNLHELLTFRISRVSDHQSDDAEDSKSSRSLEDPGLLSPAAGADVALPVLLVDSDWPTVVRGAGNAGVDNLPKLTNPNTCAYVIYTSGSTGKPKGVMVSHGGLVNTTLWHRRCYQVTSRDRASQYVAPAFDPVQLEVWPFLTAGASLYVVPEDVRTVPHALRTWMHTRRITVTLLPTPVAEAFLMDGARVRSNWPSALRVLYTGGDKLHPPPQVVLPFRLDNHYGPSECTILCSYHVVELDGNAPPIGKPIDNTHLFVLDSQLQPVPVGVTGELFIMGAGVGLGYLRRPELTKERFMEPPQAVRDALRALGVQYDRMYRTGDQVRYLPDGSLEFVGRVDFQVKIRGYRVELGEIETTLVSHASVIECSVAVRQLSGQQQLVAYVVPVYLAGKSPGQPIVEGLDSNLMSELRGYLKDRLPEYMVPVAWVALNALPLTANGKVDRNALPMPPPSAFATSMVAPVTPLHKQLAGMFKAVLEIAEIGIHDNFFELGGHSLTATQLLAQIQDTFHVEVPLTKFFVTPTIAGVSAYIEAPDTARANAMPSEVLNAEAECALPEDIAVPRGTPVPEGPLRHAFLTGATGFVGAFLLGELLQRTSGRISCLVRAKSPEEGLSRLRKVINDYEILLSADHWQRVHIVNGDLALRKFGISDQVYDDLRASVDHVFHCGAFVHSVYTYTMLKEANVGGTLEALRLAVRASPPAAVHFISTLSVFPMRPGAVPESLLLPLEDFEALHEGYAKSKWVADRLVAAAAARHVPVTVHRLGRVTGHSTTGVASVEDFMCRMIKGCVQLGGFPLLSWPVDMNPVDLVARGIVHTALQPASYGKAFHMCHPRPLGLQQLFDWLSAHGWRMQAMPYSAWLHRAREATSRDQTNALAPVMPVFTDDMGDGGDLPIFRTDNALASYSQPSQSHAALGSDVYPAIDDAMLSTCYNYFVRINFLPVPAETHGTGTVFDLEM